MDNNFILFASTLKDALNYNSCIRYEALDIEYMTSPVSIMANTENEAISSFHKSNIYEEFCERQRIRHNEYVYTYIKEEKDAFFHRVN